MPQPQTYRLGVQARTVTVDGSTPIEASNQRVGVRVAPGYGEAVYGQLIVSVAPDSPAYHAGLEPGDIIVDANGVPMDNGQNLSYAVQNSGGRLEMKVVDVRTNQLTWVVAIVGESPIDNGEIVETSVRPQLFKVAQSQPQRQPPQTLGRVKQTSAQPNPVSAGTSDRRPPVRRK